MKRRFTRKKLIYLMAIAVIISCALVIGGCAKLVESETQPSATDTQASASAEISDATASPESTEAPNATTSPAAEKSDKVSVEKTLEGLNAYTITWSPDMTVVVYIADSSDASNIFAWKVGEKDPKYLAINGGTTSGFTWSPNSAYFLINVGHMGPGNVTSTIYEVKTLQPTIPDLTSISGPVWSSDSRYIALSTAKQDDSGYIAVDVYTIADKSITTLVSAKNTTGFFKIISWSDGVITYTETDSSGNITNKTVSFPGA